MTAEQPTCSKCGDTGFIRLDEERTKECVCLYAKRVQKHLGVEIASSENIPNGLLFKYGDGKVTLDRTQEDLFLSGVWEDLLPHLKWAFLCKGMGFSFLTVTDERLKNVWLGSEAYTKKQQKKREDGESFNGLHDLIEKPHLLIIRLGFLGYSNKAMPGILKEALLLRRSATKPTWVMEDPSIAAFNETHHSYDPAVAAYIREGYERVVIPRAQYHVEDLSPETPIPEKPLPQKPVKPAKPPPERKTPTSNPLDDVDLESGVFGSKKRKKRDWS